MSELEHLLVRHLRSWLGMWPPRGRLTVVGSELRVRPGWDGEVHPLVGVATPSGIVLSVPPSLVGAVSAQAPDPTDPAWHDRLAAAMGCPDMVVGMGVFRAAGPLPALPPLGDWVPVDDPAVPSWLHPFGGEVLIARDADGAYAAGVGLKRHDPAGRELAVGTEPAHRGRGLARRLVVTAARRVLADGLAATYLHDPGNAASAAVARGAGFPDRGWWAVGMWPSAATAGSTDRGTSGR